MQLRKVNNSAAALNIHYQLMTVFKNMNPDPVEKQQCRFMLFVRLRPGIPSHFRDRKRTGYYPGDKYTDKENEMITGLVKMVHKEYTEKKRFDRYELYDNVNPPDTRIILKITDDYIESNDLKLYSIMFGKFQLPQWLL